MDLDEFGQKHWYYRLKREYENEAKILRRLEQRQAKKDFRKLMKKYKIEEVLEQEINFEKVYDQQLETQRELPPGYIDEKEFQFYGDDLEFMRFHKRTKQNMQQTL